MNRTNSTADFTNFGKDGVFEVAWGGRRDGVRMRASEVV